MADCDGQYDEEVDQLDVHDDDADYDDHDAVDDAGGGRENFDLDLSVLIQNRTGSLLLDLVHSHKDFGSKCPKGLTGNLGDSADLGGRECDKSNNHIYHK